MLKLLIFFIALNISFSTYANDCGTILNELIAQGRKTEGLSTTAKKILDYAEQKFDLPPFTNVEPQDFLDAYMVLDKAYRKIFEEIISNKDKPTFENTLAVIESIERKVFNLQTAFAHLSYMNLTRYNDASLKMWDAADDINSLISRSKKLYDKIAKIDQSNLTDEQKLVVKRYLDDFRNSGVSLPKAKKEKLSEIDKKLNVLTNQFSLNAKLADEEYRYVIKDQTQLKGLPEDIIAEMKDLAIAEGSPKAWHFSMENPAIFMSILRNSEDRELRKAITLETRKLGSEGKHDNRQILIDIVNLRHEKAKLLGYESWSDMALESRMAKSVSRVEEFYRDLVEKVMPIAERENQELLDFAKSKGHKGKVEPWDRVYYFERLKQEKYGFNSELVRPYFQLSHVAKGFFKIIKEIMNVEIKEVPIKTYHKSVKLFEVYDLDTKRLTGKIFYDPYTRTDKTDGAHHMKMKLNDGDAHSLGVVVTNFSEHKNGDALLDFSQVETFFHEFGHALHATLSQSKYLATSTAYTPRDFVELQSQFLENLLREDYVLELVGKHVETGERIPQELIKKLQAANNFRKASTVLGQSQMGMLDMAFYKKPLNISADELVDWEMDVLRDTYIKLPEYPSSISATFQHIFSGGYSAGYYGYLWAEILDKDAYAYVMKGAGKDGRPNKEKMKLLKRWIYSDGTFHSADEQYDRFKQGEKLDPSHFTDLLDE